MNNTMECKNYIGSVELSESDSLFFGKVMGIRAMISYEGTTAKELVANFRAAVDAYLDLCAEEGKEPERAYNVIGGALETMCFVSVSASVMSKLATAG